MTVQLFSLFFSATSSREEEKQQFLFWQPLINSFKMATGSWRRFSQNFLTVTFCLLTMMIVKLSVWCKNVKSDGRKRLRVLTWPTQVFSFKGSCLLYVSKLSLLFFTSWIGCWFGSFSSILKHWMPLILDDWLKVAPSLESHFLLHSNDCNEYSSEYSLQTNSRRVLIKNSSLELMISWWSRFSQSCADLVLFVEILDTQDHSRLVSIALK